jgi:hypothetical protein
MTTRDIDIFGFLGLTALLLWTIACVFFLSMPAAAWGEDYRRDPVYGWDPRCDTGARYEAMAAGYNCSAPKPGKSVWQAAKCEAYSVAANSCTALRGLVKVNGLAAVKATARKCGASEEQIKERESSCQ